jgi:hypothetical protein
MKDDEYIEPSTKVRILFIIYFAFLVFLVFVGKTETDQFQFTENATQEQLDNSIQSFKELINYLLVFTVLQAILFSTYFVLIANKSIRTGKFPPVGIRVIKRTKIVQGERAFYSACLTYFLALSMWLLILVPAYLKWFLNEFT